MGEVPDRAEGAKELPKTMKKTGLFLTVTVNLRPCFLFYGAFSDMMLRSAMCFHVP